MPAPWQKTGGGTAGVTITVSATPANGGQQNRLRQLSATLGGSTAGNDILSIYDGTAATGTLIAQFELSIPANGSCLISLAGMDLRASPGNPLTLVFAGGIGDEETINASGDIIPVGYPMFQS